jgi:tyrosyl-tRNA synthetase
MLHRFLLLFTEVPVDTIMNMKMSCSGEDWNKAKIILADETTRLLHGDEACAIAKRAASALYGKSASTSYMSSPLITSSEVESRTFGGTVDSQTDIKSITSLPLDGVQHFDVLKSNCSQQRDTDVYEISLVQILVLARLTSSMNAARRMIKAGGISVDDLRIDSEYASFRTCSAEILPEDTSIRKVDSIVESPYLQGSTTFKISVGKKKHMIIRMPSLFMFVKQ